MTGIIGNWSDVCTARTTVSSITRGGLTLATFLGGMVLSPTLGILAIPIGGPVAMVGGVAGAPILASALARSVTKRFGPHGTLTQSSGKEEAAPATQAQGSDSADSLSHSSAEESGNIQSSTSGTMSMIL